MAKTAIVTGGLSGIGLSIARALHEQGHHVGIGARRGGDPDQQKQVKSTIGRNAFVLPLDVRSEGSVLQFCKNATADAPPLILVNAAGVTLHHPVTGHSLDDWSTVLDTNLTGPFLMIRAVLPEMINAGWGRIINIASTAAHTAMADHPAYCASKSGLLGLSRAVALEGAPHGVTCTTVSPTWVETDMLRNSAAQMAQENGTTQAQEIAALATANPQNRLVQPAEIAALVAFLCSDAAPALTMEDIQVSAGAFW